MRSHAAAIITPQASALHKPLTVELRFFMKKKGTAPSLDEFHKSDASDADVRAR